MAVGIWYGGWTIVHLTVKQTILKKRGYYGTSICQAQSLKITKKCLVSEFLWNLQFRVCEFRKVSLGVVISCTGQTIFAWGAASGQEVEIGKWFLTFLLNVSSFHLERGQFLLMCAKISPRCLITLGTSCWALMSNKNDHYIMKKRFFSYIIADYAICMKKAEGKKVIENKLRGGINKCNACM